MRPIIVLPITAAVVVLAALLAPQSTFGRTGDARLSTYSTEPQGARLFYEMAQRFGWRAEQRRTPDFAAGTDVIEAVLDPVVPLRAVDVHTLLEHVRQGGALLAVLGDGAALLGDSLQLRLGAGQLRTKGEFADSSECKGLPASPRTFWPGDAMSLYSLEWKGPRPDTIIPLVTVGSPHTAPAAIAFPYGRGRIVVGSDPDLLRNDVLRVCSYNLDVPATRMLAYLRDGGGTRRERIVFDEYHQGFGDQPGTMRAVAGYMTRTGSGRLFFQLMAAGLVLLLAVAPRTIPPCDAERVERRSPLEHVDALGRAYAQVGATRSATARLVRGVRRRLAGGATPTGIDPSDDAFLDRAKRDVPALADDVTLIRQALRTPVSRRDFASVGAALERVELSLTRI